MWDSVAMQAETPSGFKLPVEKHWTITRFEAVRNIFLVDTTSLSQFAHNSLLGTSIILSSVNEVMREANHLNGSVSAGATFE